MGFISGRLIARILSLSLVVAAAACSGSKEEVKEEVAPDNAATGSEEAKEAPAAETADGEATEESAADVSEVPAPASAVAPAVGSAPATGGSTVKYVKAKSTAVYDKPQGKVVRRLSKGDHVLVEIDGEWARIFDGTYVKAKDLTDQAIGRKKHKAVWK